MSRKCRLSVGESPDVDDVLIGRSRNRVSMIAGANVRVSTPSGRFAQSRLLSAVALAVVATWPAAGSPFAFLEFLGHPTNATFSGRDLFGVLDPADELIAGERRDVFPRVERDVVVDQRFTQVSRKLVDDSAGYSLAAHGTMVSDRTTDCVCALPTAMMPSPRHE